jgi:hypothetical protein
LSSSRPPPPERAIDADAPAPPPPATIFVSDPSAEAERVAQALRSEGFVVVDVPLSMLVSRASVQPPRVVIVDFDAEGVADELKKLRELPTGDLAQIVFLGTGDVTQRERATKEMGGQAFFLRPVDIGTVVRRAVSLAGGAPPAAPRPSTPPPSLPSSRQPSGALPPASMRAPAPENPISPGPRPSSMLPPLLVSTPAVPLESLRRPSSQGPLSSELEQLLADAEARVGAQLAPDSVFPTPEDEIEAVLPAEVLESLDEPLDEDEEDEVEPAFGGHNRATTSGGRQATTGAGRVATGAGRVETRPGARAETRPPPEPRRSPSDAPRTSAGGTFAGSTTGRGLVTEHSSAGTRVDGSVRPDPSAPGGVPSPMPAPPPMPLPPMSPPRLDSPRFDPSRLDSPRLESPRNATVPPPTAAQPSPFSVEPRASAAQPAASMEPLPSTGPRSDGSGPSAPPSPALAPVVLGPGDAPRLLAQAIASRSTGALCFESPEGVRRAVLREGDVVTAASGIDGENLLAFLGARGELPREQIDRLIGKLPPFGRHAGAALVAHGHLRQDQLWPVLRAHAEWLLSHMLLLPSGNVQLEPEPPGRLKGEPSVFGGATGSEVFVEIVRRVISPEEALSRLGGPNGRIGQGPNAPLLAECALSPQDTELLEAARGASLRELVDRAPNTDVLAVVYALSLLGVVEMVRAVADERAVAAEQAAPAQPADIEALDEEALRARVRARMQLIEEGDYFEVLGIARDATGYEVRRAFLELRRAFEPARILTPRLADLNADVRKITTVLDEAYEILKDSARRERYRRAIEGRPS